MLPPDVRLRPALDDDAPWLAGLWASAFPGRRTAEIRLRELRAGDGRYGGLETCWVGERGGERVGALRSYPFRMALWGRDLPVQGLAAVAVAPEFRRQGLGQLLCARAIRRARGDGHVLSVLFPFRRDFYGRLGYTLAGALHRYEVAPAEFPLFEEGREVRALPASEAGERVPAFYERVRRSTQGLIGRTRAMWDFLDEPGVRTVVVPAGEGGAGRAAGHEGAADGTADEPFAGGEATGRGAAGHEGAADGLRGYLVAEPLTGRTRRGDVLQVREALVEDFSAHRALLGWISLQRDQWSRVVYDALPGEHLDRLLGHPRREGARNTRPGALWFPSATVLRGPMVRILNVEEVLDGVPMPAGAVLRVSDDVIPENAGTWEGGGPRPPEPAAAEREPDGDDDALPIALVTELFLNGAIPGQRAALDDAWRPLLGLHDFRLLDTF